MYYVCPYFSLSSMFVFIVCSPSCELIGRDRRTRLIGFSIGINMYTLQKKEIMNMQMNGISFQTLARVDAGVSDEGLYGCDNDPG